VTRTKCSFDIGYRPEASSAGSSESLRFLAAYSPLGPNPADEVLTRDEIDALVAHEGGRRRALILSKKRARFELAEKQSKPPSRRAGSRSVVSSRQGVLSLAPGACSASCRRRSSTSAALADLGRVPRPGAPPKVSRAQPLQNKSCLSRRAGSRETNESAADDSTSVSARRCRRRTYFEHRRLRARSSISTVIDGLIHISELLRGSHVNHPSDVLRRSAIRSRSGARHHRDRQRISSVFTQPKAIPACK